MMNSREEWKKEIQEIVAQQDELRKILAGLDARVLGLQAKADFFAEDFVPEIESAVLPAFPSMETPPPIPAIALTEAVSVLPPVSIPAPVSQTPEVPFFAEKPVLEPEPTYFSTPPSIPTSHSIPTEQPEKLPKKEKTSLEFKLGTYWLVRIGIVMFLAALVFAGNYAYENFVATMGPAPKVALLYVIGGALTGLGAWMEKKGGKLLNFSRVLFAGGLSAIYYITYAAHYVPRLQVIESPLLAGALLLAWAAVIAWLADRRKSETLAVLSVLLAYFTSGMNPMAGFTLFSNLILTVAAVFFFIRHRWAVISWVGLVGTYASFGYWRAFGLVDHSGFDQTVTESPWLLLAILAGYWIVFTAATFSRPGRESGGAQKITFLTANNSAFFGYGCLLLASPGFLTFWQLSAGLGVLLLLLSTLAAKLEPEDAPFANAYFSQGLLLITVGLISYFEGQSLALVMAMESVFLLSCGLRGKNWIALLGSYATAVVAVLVESWILLDQPGSGLYTATAVSAFLLFNAWWLRRNLKEEEQKRDDARAWFFTLGALGVALLCSWMNSSENTRPVLLSFEAVILLAACHQLRLREAALFSQAFWLAAFVGWLALGWADHHRVTPLAHLSVLLSALLLGHAWKWIPLGRAAIAASFYRAVFAFGAVAVLAGWILPGQSTEKIVVLGAGLALLLMAYGFGTRFWFLALFGQVFLWTSAGISITLDEDRPFNWALALLPIFEMVLIRRALPRSLVLLGISSPSLQEPMNWAGRLYQLASLILGWVWIARFIPEEWKAAAYIAAGFVLFLFVTFRRVSPRSFEDKVLLLASAFFTALGWIFFVYDGLPNLQNALALLLIPLAENLGRRKEGLSKIPRIVLVTLGVLGVLVFVTRFTEVHLSSNYWTVSWGILAGTVFATGFVLKHSWYRWAGLALLALAIGRVGVVDIWRFHTIYRILSLFVLSGMAIGLGFLYTRYQEKMKEWL